MSFGIFSWFDSLLLLVCFGTLFFLRDDFGIKLVFDAFLVILIVFGWFDLIS